MNMRKPSNRTIVSKPSNRRPSQKPARPISNAQPVDPMHTHTPTRDRTPGICDLIAPPPVASKTKTIRADYLRPPVTALPMYQLIITKQPENTPKKEWHIGIFPTDNKENGATCKTAFDTTHKFAKIAQAHFLVDMCTQSTQHTPHKPGITPEHIVKLLEHIPGWAPMKHRPEYILKQFTHSVCAYIYKRNSRRTSTDPFAQMDDKKIVAPTSSCFVPKSYTILAFPQPTASDTDDGQPQTAPRKINYDDIMKNADYKADYDAAVIALAKIGLAVENVGSANACVANGKFMFYGFKHIVRIPPPNTHKRTLMHTPADIEAYNIETAREISTPRNHAGVANVVLSRQHRNIRNLDQSTLSASARYLDAQSDGSGTSAVSVRGSPGRSSHNTTRSHNNPPTASSSLTMNNGRRSANSQTSSLKSAHTGLDTQLDRSRSTSTNSDATDIFYGSDKEVTW